MVAFGSLALWLFGSLALWLFGSLALWLFGSLDLSVCPGFRAAGQRRLKSGIDDPVRLAVDLPSRAGSGALGPDFRKVVPVVEGRQQHRRRDADHHAQQRIQHPFRGHLGA